MALSLPKYRDLYRKIKHEPVIRNFFNSVKIEPEDDEKNGKTIYYNAPYISIFTRWKRPTKIWHHDTLDVLIIYDDLSIDDKIYFILMDIFSYDIATEIKRYATTRYYLEYHSSYYDARYNTKLKDILSEMFIESHERFVRVYGQGSHADDFKKWIKNS